MSHELMLKRDLIKFFLNNSVSKLPIKRSDITANVFNKTKNPYKDLFTEVINELNEVYGIKVVELPETKSAKQFICISSLTAVSSLEYTPSQRSELALLFVILSFIYMEGGTVKEDVLYRFLKKFGIETDKPHNYFGDVKKLLSETFPKQLYLKRVKVTSADHEESFELSWGFRGDLEFPKKDVLNEVAQIFNRDPKDFLLQYQEIYDEEEEDTELAELTQEL